MPVKTSSPFFLFPPERTLYSKFRATNLRLSSQSNNVVFVSTTSNVTQTTVLADFLTSRRCVLIISTQCATKHPFFQILKKELVPLQNRLEKQCFLVVVQKPSRSFADTFALHLSHCILILSSQFTTKHPFFQILKKGFVLLQSLLEKHCFLTVAQKPSWSLDDK